MTRYVLTACISALLAGCAAPGASPALSPAQFATLVPSPTGAELPAETPPLVTDIPASLLDAMLQQASDLSSMPVSELTIERAEAVTWNDGSLGCPEPGMMYTQALVDGYWVVIRAGEAVYDFRGSGTRFRLCTGGAGRPAPTIEIPPPIY
jgi:hypothetical protein